MDSKLLAFLFGVVSVFLSFLLARRNTQLRESESELETAREEAAKARKEASKATAQKESSSVSTELAKRAAQRIAQTMQDGGGNGESALELVQVERQLEDARESNDIDRAMELAAKQAQLAVSLGMGEDKGGTEQ